MPQVCKACLESLPDDLIGQVVVPVLANVMMSNNYSDEKTSCEHNGVFIEITSHGMTLRIMEKSSLFIERALHGTFLCGKTA